MNDSEGNKFRRNRRHIRHLLNEPPSNLSNEDVYADNDNRNSNSYEKTELGCSSEENKEVGCSF